MAEGKVKKDDLIEPGLFEQLAKEADVLLKKQNEYVVTLKQTLEVSKEIALTSKLNTGEGLQKQAANIKLVERNLQELEQTEKEMIEVQRAKILLEQEEIKLKRLVDAENKKNIRALSELNREYKKGTTDLNKLKKELKELEFTGRTNGKLYKALSQEFIQLDSKIRKAEKSVGEFQRNVGNYPKALDGIGAKLATVFSVGSVVAFGEKILETRAEFQKFEAVLTNTLRSGAAAEQVLTRIQTIAAKTPFSVKELTESFVKLANQGFEPTNEELIKLGDLAASQGKSFDQLTEGIIDAQTGEFERLKEFGIRASKEGDKVKFTFKGVQTQTDFNAESIRKYVLSLGELEGVSGGMAAISEKLGGKISNLGDNFDTFFNNLGKNTQGVFAVFLDSFNTLLGQANEAQTLFNKINEELVKQGGEITLIEKLTTGNAQLVVLQQNLTAITNSGKSNIAVLKGLQVSLSQVNAQYKSGLITEEEYRNSLILIGGAIRDQNEIMNAAKPIKEKDTALTKEQVKAAKELAKANKDLNNQLIALRVENTQLDQRREEDKVKNEFRLSKEALEESKGSAETKAKILVELEIKLQQQLIDIKDKYAKEERDRKAKEAEELAKKEAELDEKVLDSARKTADANAQFSEQETKKIQDELDKRAARRQQEYEDAIKTSEQLLDIAAKEFEKKAQLRQEYFDKEINDTETNIDRQRQLAEKGLQNTLAFEEEKKARLQVEKEEEAKKEQRRQEVIAFMRLLASYAEKDPDGALQKALRDTLLAKAIAGAFYEGTEKVSDDLQGNPNVRDGYIVRVDGSERVMTGEQNKKVGNLSNEELAQLAHNYNTGKLFDDNLLKIATQPSDTFAKNIENSVLLSQVMQQNRVLNEIKEAISSRPVNSFEFNKMGEFVLSTIEKGFEKRTTHKLRKPRL